MSDLDFRLVLFPIKLFILCLMNFHFKHMIFLYKVNNFQSRVAARFDQSKTIILYFLNVTQNV